MEKEKMDVMIAVYAMGKYAGAVEAMICPSDTQEFVDNFKEMTDYSSLRKGFENDCSENPVLDKIVRLLKLKMLKDSAND